MANNNQSGRGSGSMSNNRYQKYFLDIVSLYNRRPDLKAFLEILLSLATIGIFALFALRPTFVTIATLLTSIKDKKETVAQMDAKIENLGLVQTAFETYKQDIAILDTAIPSQPNPQLFVRQIESLASKDNVNVISIRVDELDLVTKNNNVDTTSTATESAKTMGITINTSGDFVSVHQFLSDLENLRQPFKISNLVININQITDSLSLVLTARGEVPYIE